MAGDDPSDRRRAERVPINLEFSAVPSVTYISDLSEYGVFVHTPRPANLGVRIRLRFSVLLDDPVIITAEGRVVRHQGAPESPGMGIEFTDLDPETILRINDVVSRQRPRDSGPALPSDDDKTRVASLPATAAASSDEAQPELRAPPLPSDEEEIDESQQTGLFRALEVETMADDAPDEDS